DVHVTESTAADPLHVRAAALDPVAIDELPLCAGGRGHDLDVTRSRATRTHTQHYLPAGSIRELSMQIRAAVECGTIERQQLIADRDLTGDVCRSELDDFGDHEAAVVLVGDAIEAESEPACRRAVTSLRRTCATGMAEVRRVQLAE